MYPGGDPVHGTDLIKDDGLTPVERWRKNAFRQAGFSPQSSELLALSQAMVHDVLKALEKGCSLDLAFQIFL